MSHAALDGITYRNKGSTSLGDFSSPVTEVIPHLGTGSAKSGYTFKCFRLTAANGLPNRALIRAAST